MTDPRATSISVDPSGLVVVTTTDVQAALAELDAAVGGGGYTDEQARDAIGAALVAGTDITITVNDGANTITIDSTAGGGTASAPTFIASGSGQGSIAAPNLIDTDDVILWITRANGNNVTPPFGTEIEDLPANGSNYYTYGWHRLTTADLDGPWAWTSSTATEFAIYRGVVGTPSFAATTKITTLTATSVTMPSVGSLASTDRVVRLLGTASNTNPQITLTSGAALRSTAVHGAFWCTFIADNKPDSGTASAVACTIAGSSDYIYTSVTLAGV